MYLNNLFSATDNNNNYDGITIITIITMVLFLQYYGSKRTTFEDDFLRQTAAEQGPG